MVDERDGKGLGDDSKAKVKQIFKIDLAAPWTSWKHGWNHGGHERGEQDAVPRHRGRCSGISGITPDQVPAKLEGLAFGPDITSGGVKTHTLVVANDNDFLQDFDGPEYESEQFYLFGFTDADLGGRSRFRSISRNSFINWVPHFWPILVEVGILVSDLRWMGCRAPEHQIPASPSE